MIHSHQLCLSRFCGNAPLSVPCRTLPAMRVAFSTFKDFYRQPASKEPCASRVVASMSTWMRWSTGRWRADWKRWSSCWPNMTLCLKSEITWAIRVVSIFDFAYVKKVWNW
ncbi:conserved hypothetical protein [Trichinella spiralis]|uniref:hypothetical protein n=1 Tax=Trichinella spiralis TaxID=6334 RepID=UPI0001EFBB7B|nr:conserved hypothetical protein [Trichinella spiralis]